MLFFSIPTRNFLGEIADDRHDEQHGGSSGGDGDGDGGGDGGGDGDRAVTVTNGGSDMFESLSTVPVL